LVSLAGLATFVLFAVLISAHPSKIDMRILVAGLEIQFILGVILIRTEFGYQFFKFLSSQATSFLGYTDRGSQLVFGDKYVDHIFAFKVILSVLFVQNS
jgi:pyrimidine nucleoside transport protein